MQTSPHLHALRIPFTIPVAPDRSLPRFVYAYIVLCDREVWLVDSGVAGTEERIAAYLRELGRDLDEVSTVVLTHSHPDHIGAVAAIQKATNCDVLIHEAERPWLEDVNRQCRERPVPGFDTLVSGSAHVTGTFGSGVRLLINEGIALEVLHTPGHSTGSVTFWIEGEGTLITGDAVISAGDLPIYDDYRQCVASLRRLAAINGVKTLLSSWDEPKRDEAVGKCFQEGLEYLGRINEAVRGEQLGRERPFVAVAVACFILTGLSLPFLLIYAEHLIWLAAWFVRRPWMQDRLKPLRSSEAPPLRVEKDKESRL